ncbi:MAG: rRNA maturation RNase YbeY [Lachnospiraceae bacterium]|nr:rRNA maturation RNase YbeY [Lachnospiraceae bacterium]
MVNYECETAFEPDFDAAGLAGEVSLKVLSEEGCPEECEIELIVTDPETVRGLNRDYRGIDRTTDVLSFPNAEWEKPADFEGESFRDPFLKDPDTGRVMLGQIVLNAEKIFRQAEEYGHSAKREFAFLVAHSMLHLLGYDHESEEEAALMEEKQKLYLEALGITR